MATLEMQVRQDRRSPPSKYNSGVFRLLRVLKQRGAFGSRCNNELCDNGGADWFSRASGQYYCDECARAINEMCLAQGTRKLCELRL